MSLWKPLAAAAACVAVVVAVAVSRMQRPTRDPCAVVANATAAAEGGGDAIDACRVFSPTYAAASDKFRKAARAVSPGVKLHSLAVLEEKNQRYAIDIAVIQGTRAGYVVHLSGVHGVEGYAGSAIQVAFLEQLAAAKKQTPRHDVPTVILVHAVNPFGMARNRRTNEHNVDLNRNCLTADQWKTYAPNHFNREAYSQFDEALFNPAIEPSPFSFHVTFWIKAIAAIGQHGISKLKAAMVGGQYHKPAGIFYGGSEQEPSIQKLTEWFDDYLREKDTAAPVTLIDVHTGLGPFGMDTLLPHLSLNREHVRAEFQEWFPDSLSVFSDKSAVKVSQGYEQIQGTAADYFYKRFFNASTNPLAFTQEFGTLSLVLVGRALVVENAAYHYATDKEEWARRTTRAAFDPSSIEWRKSVVQRGLACLQQSIKRTAQTTTDTESE
jgi:hypothetical protein